MAAADKKAEADAPAAILTMGPGTELKKMLGAIGFRPDRADKCGCVSTAARMDREGADWCEDNVPWILERMQYAAKVLGVPYFERVCRWVINTAIARARRSDLLRSQLQNEQRPEQPDSGPRRFEPFAPRGPSDPSAGGCC